MHARMRVRFGLNARLAQQARWPRWDAGAGSPTEVIFQLTPIMGITVLLLSLFHEQLWYTLPGAWDGQAWLDG
jgi:hypothetical protein